MNLVEKRDFQLETYEIKWTSRAAKDLRKIYSFFSELYSEEMAFKLTGSLTLAQIP